MKRKQTKFQKALNIVTKTIKKDADLYYTYQANIAVQFQDEYIKFYHKASFDIGICHVIHEISNNAAKNFLDLWVKK